MQINEALETIGLNDKEARVYAALLALGDSTAYVIADRAGIKKPTTYVILEQLIKKGAARRIPRLRKARYAAVSPEEIFSAAEEKVKRAKEALPLIKALAEGKAPKSKTLFFEGLPAVRQAFLNQARQMENKELVGFYAHVGDISKETLLFVDEYNEELKRRNVKIRGIAPNHPNLKPYRKKDKACGRTIKTVPLQNYSSPISVDIGEKHTLFFEPKAVQATLIESPKITSSLKQIFEILWSMTK